MLTTCVAWSLHPWISYITLPTWRKAFGHLLPVMPALFLRLSIDSSFLKHSPWFQRDIERAMRKPGGGKGALGDWIMMGGLL